LGATLPVRAGELEKMMSVLIVLLVFGAALVAGNFFLNWLLAETSEEQPLETEEARARRERSFYRTKTWIALRRLFAKRPPLLMSRRDKNGRFRKMSRPANARPAPTQRRRAPRPRRTSQRPSRVQSTAE
jgi:hypothetical protein